MDACMVNNLQRLRQTEISALGSAGLEDPCIPADEAR